MSRTDSSEYVPYHYGGREETNSRFDETVNVLHDMVEYSYRACLKTMWPEFVNTLVYGSYKKNIFDLTKHLCLMGLDNDVNQLLTILHTEGESHRYRLQMMLNHLYQLFDKVSGASSLSGDDCDARLRKHNESLKRLKKLIHQFARDNNFDRRLFNLRKLRSKLQKEKEAATNEEERRKKHRQLEYILTLQTAFPDRNYAYISRRNLSIDPVTTDKERTRRRQIKSVLNGLSLVVSIIVSLAKALVAVIFMIPILPLLPVILFFGIPSFIANYYFFRSSSYQILKDIVFFRIWKNPKTGEWLKWYEIACVVISLLFSFLAALSFGFLSFSSAIHALAIIGLATGPPGIAIAGIIAIVTTLALFVVLTHMTVNWIRNDGPRKLLNKIRNLPSEFINFWKHENWSTLTNRQRAVHVIRKVITAMCKVLFFALAITTVILVNIATTGLLKHKSADMFLAVFHLSRPVAQGLSWTIVGVGSLINWIYYGNGVMKMFKGTKTVALAAIHPKQSARKLKENWNSIKHSPIRIFNRVTTWLKRSLLLTSVGLNAVAQWEGIAGDQTAASLLGPTLPPAAIARGVSSAGRNAMACQQATEPVSTVNSPTLASRNSSSLFAQRRCAGTNRAGLTQNDEMRDIEENEPYYGTCVVTTGAFR